MPSVAASVQSAHIRDGGFGSFSFDLQCRHERVFSINDDSVRRPFDSDPDHELPRHSWPLSQFDLVSDKITHI
jgi:hypothetical protein